MKQLVIGLAAIGLIAGCASDAGTHSSAGGMRASATLMPKSGSKVRGRVGLWEQDDNQVALTVTISGLPPNGMFGFHVHEKGDCSAPDGSSALGHFNPTGEQHGDSRAGPHHAGDIPMLRSDARGRAIGSVLLGGVTLAPGPTSLVGRAVVIHAGRDDYKTQPAGNSGARIACGVIVAD